MKRVMLTALVITLTITASGQELKEYGRDDFGFSTEGFLPEAELEELMFAFSAPPDGPMQDDIQYFLQGLLIGREQPWRLEQAKSHAIWDFDHFFVSYMGAVGINSTQAGQLVHLRRLVALSAHDVDLLVNKIKKRYHRERPYVYYGLTFPSTDAVDRERLRTTSSFPSGHASLGRISCLILMQVFPDKAERIVLHADDFARSRTLLHFHWNSDLAAAESVANLVFSRLIVNRNFQECLSAAIAEANKLSVVAGQSEKKGRRAYE